MNLSRRTFGLDLIATLAVPAIIRTPGLLMPIKVPIVRDEPREVLRPCVKGWWTAYDPARREWRDVFLNTASIAA